MTYFKFSLKQLIATIIGAILYFLLARFLSIPILIDVYIAFQFAIVGFFAASFGPISGLLIGLAGQMATDLSFNLAPWWSWVIACAVVGFASGFILKPGKIENGDFYLPDAARFIIGSLIAHALAWCAAAPGFDVLIYSETAGENFTQYLITGACNFLITAVFGTLLLYLYSGTRVNNGKG